VLFLVSPCIVQVFMIDTSIKRTWQQLKVKYKNTIQLRTAWAYHGCRVFKSSSIYGWGNSWRDFRASPKGPS